MTPEQLAAAAQRLFGDEYVLRLAAELGVSRIQVWRYLSGRTPAPGPVVAAVKCWLEKQGKSDERND